MSVSVSVRSHGNEMTSLNALMPSQRAATLSLSSPTDHQSNFYDVLLGDDATGELRRAYDRPSTCCDDDYLTPAPVTSDRWTTSTMESYDRIANDGGYQTLNDSGKYLQLQGSVYYEYI